jgi:site-specific recombinase XerD
VTERRTWPGTGTGALFLNRRGGRLSARAVGHLLDELAADTGLVDDTRKPDVAPHDIRHTFGTRQVRDGTDIVTVAELMGHRRLDTTMLYTLPTQADVEAAVSRRLLLILQIHGMKVRRSWILAVEYPAYRAVSAVC